MSIRKHQKPKSEKPDIKPVGHKPKVEQLSLTFEQWFEVLQGFVKAGNCLIDDIYGVHKIDRVSLADNDKGKATGIIFKSKR